MKTLGIKFEVAGVKEAQAGLNSFKNSLNQSLTLNKQASKESLRQANQNGRIEQRRQMAQSFSLAPEKKTDKNSRSAPEVQRGEVLYDYFDNYQRILAAIKKQQYGQAAETYLRPRANTVIGGFYNGIGDAAGNRFFSQFDAVVRKLLGKEEYRESVDLSEKTIALLGQSIGNSLSGKDSDGAYKANKFQSQRDKNAGIKSGNQESLIESVINQALVPIRTLNYSFFEGIGANFGNRFAEGLNQVLNDEMDVSFERKGAVTGKAIGFTAKEGLDNFKQNFNKVGDNFNDLRYSVEDRQVDQVAPKLDVLVKSVSKTITSIADSYLRGFRRGSVQLEALRKVEAEIAKQNNQAPDLTGKKKVIYTASGFAGEKGQRGYLMADQLRNYVTDDTAVIGAENKYTETFAPSDKNTVLWGIGALSTLAKINLKGFNPDAVELAAKVVNTLAANPDVEVELMGHSAGGFPVEEAQQILDLLGYAGRVKSKIIGTPRMLGDLDNANTERLMGDNDFRIKPLELGLEYAGLAKPTENIVKGVKDHFWEDYLNSDDFLEAALGESLDKTKVKSSRQKKSPFKGKLIELESLYSKYLSTIYQDLDDLGEELSVAPDRLVAKNRRGKLRDRGVKEVNRKLRDKDFKPISVKPGTETAVLISGGFAGVEGRSGAALAKGLNELVDDGGKTQYKGVRNPYTDVFKRDENLSDQQSLEKVLDLFKDVHERGYNPDSAEIAAQVIDLLNKNPNLKVKIGGYSGGGYPMEDVAELLKSQGVNMSRVELMGIGTPELPGGIKNREFKKVLGANDNVFKVSELKKLNNQVKEIIGFDIFPELMAKLQNIPKINDHSLEAYIEQSKEVQDFFYGNMPDVAELLANRAEIEDLKDHADFLGGTIEDISQDETSDPAKKLTRLNEIKSEFISVLRDIHELAKYSETIKGGKYFREEREKAAENLEEAGIIVDPVKVSIAKEEDPWVETPQEEAKVINNRSKNLAQEYKKYLQSIGQKTTSDRALISQVIAREFAGANSRQQKELLTFIKQNFSAKAKAYRAAVKSGQLELAREQGEELVRLAASVKSLYGELAQFDQLDPEVQSSFKSYKGYVSSVESEVLTGAGGKGRANQGLPDLFEQQLNLSNEDGENVAEGFIEGILENLIDAREAGEQLIEAVEEGIRDAGEIQSPSKLAQRLGRWFAQGFGLGMSAENLETRGREVVADAADGMKAEAKESFSADNIASLLDTGGAGIIKKLGSILFDGSQGEGMNQSLNMFGQLGGKIIRLVVTFKLLKVAVDAMGLGKLVEGFRNLPEEALKSALAVETLDNRIVKISGSASQGAKNLAFITAEAKRLNLNLTNAKENYSQVLKSTRDSSLEGFQTENIYTAFAATAKANGLDQTQEQELFRSVRSIIGKGVLSQEEVRQEIGEKLGDFEKSLAEAYGVSTQQLNKMIESGELQATEALPKVAAVLKAKNDIYGDLNTGAVAAQKADNAIVSFRESVGSALLPLQKFGNNFLAGFFNQISAGINTIKPLVNGFFLALLVNLLRVQIFGQSVQKVLLGLIKVLWTLKGAIAIFAAEMALIAAAWAVWENVGKMLKERFFPQINKEIEQITRGMQAYRQAIEEANGAQSDLGNNKLQLAEGYKLPDNKFGDFGRKALGSDYLNSDSLVVEPLNKILGSKFGSVLFKTAINYIPGGVLAAPFVGNGSKTRRENKEEQLKIDNSNLSLKGNQLLADSSKASSAVEEIGKYDAQIAAIQSARLKLLPGDRDALKASLEEEKKINQERDKQLKIVTAYQQTLTTSASVYKSRLEDLEERRLDREISEGTYNSERSNLQGLLNDTEKELKAVNNELSKVGTRLSEFQRRLQKSDRRVEGFFAQSDRQLQQQKAGIIEQGIDDGTGTSVIQLELEEATKQDLSRRIDLLKKELAVLEKDLRSPELDPAVKRIKENLAKDNIPINESSLQDLIEKSPVQADKEAAQGLLRQLKKDTQLAGLSEQLAQTLQSNRNALIDLNRSIQDYLFRINQQIKEAQIEVLRIVEQIVQTNIKNKLQAAISPNAESFVNNLISSTQSLLDQTASYADKVLGSRGARIQFAGQKRTLEMELQDFARNVSGASEALGVFEQRLRAGQVASSKEQVASSNTSKSSFAAKTKEIANRLGIDPQALMTIMLFESAGTLDPKKQGPEVKNKKGVSQGRGRGLIQFMPATARGLGTSDSALAAMSDIEQLDWVEKYFAQFKGNFGAGKLENLYAAVLAGDPKALDASDGYTTARLGAQRMTREYGQKASGLLGSGGMNPNVLAVPAAPNFSTNGLPPAPPDMGQAKQDTEFLISKEEQKLDLQDSLIDNQEKEALDIAIANTFKSVARQVENEIKERQFQMDDLEASLQDLLANYDYQTADTQALGNIRAVNQAFVQRWRDTTKQVQFYTDEIDSIQKLIASTPNLIAQAKTDEERQIIYEQEANAQLLLPVYQDNLKQLSEQLTRLSNDADRALYFVREQNKLKIEQEKLTKENIILEQKANLAAQRGTVEQRRQLKQQQEEQRSQLAINQIRQNTPEGMQRNEEILGELRQSKVNKENNDYESRLEEFDIEQKLLGYQSGIGDKKAGFLSRFGLNFGAEKLKKETAIQYEKLRFERELVELEKQYKGDPEKLNQLSQAARELNSVNLKSIDNEFKSLGKTVEDYFGASTQGFFTQFTTNLYDGKAERDRALLEERLRYAEEVVGLENSNRDTPGKLAHLKNRARELNEEKLDKIRGEFNLFSRVIDLARGALLEFVKQLAQLAAQQAASKFISSILGSILGGAFGGGKNFDGVKLNKAPKVKAFKADKGITVGDEIGNYNRGGSIKHGRLLGVKLHTQNATGRKLSDRLTKLLKSNAPGVAQAWNAEGEGAQLGVFHTGEELLSRKTGEAGRYQALKARYGLNPLAKINNYAGGGTIPEVGNSILSGINSSRPRIDLSSLNNRSTASEKAASKTINIKTTVVTPNADSFRLNQDQMNQDLIERLRRGI
jgi:tape measure domain-containing protein